MNILVVLILFCGLFFFTGGSIGILRFPDFYTRLHPAGKLDTAGQFLALLAIALYVVLPELSLHTLLTAAKIVLIVIFGVVYFFHKRKRTILSTMSPLDRSIVELVMKHKTISQAAIMRELKIPRATLSRHVNDLMAKNILVTHAIGKKVDVSLHPWFLRGKNSKE